MIVGGIGRIGLVGRAAPVLLAIALAACSTPAATSGPNASPSPERPQPMPSGNVVNGAGEYLAFDVTRAAASSMDAARTASLMNAFGFDLYARAGDGNFVFSPTSIALALGMARPGASGTTAAQMDAVMHSLASPADLPALSSLDQLLGAINGTFKNPITGDMQTVSLRIANTAFAQRGMPMKKDYVSALSSTFGAGIHLCDYRSDTEAARVAINSWIANHTENRIRDMLAKGVLDTSTRLALVNAIYLKASWAKQFEKGATQQSTFASPTGTVSVPMMHETVGLLYASGQGWQAAQLPYAGGSLAMTIILPDDVGTFEKHLNAASFDAIVAALQQREVRLAMPKFKLDTKTELADRLVALGMKDAFDPNRADFTGITTAEQLYISAVVHQANIDVDETGTEAAAATVVAVAAAALPDAVQLELDRPFIFALRDTKTGAILFLGRVADPSQS